MRAGLKLFAAMLLLPLGAAAQTRQPPAPSMPTVQDALAARRDLWGELAMHQPNGPSYAFFEKLLPPLRYVDCQFRNYPIALAAPRGLYKSRLISNGSGVNLPSGLKTKSWYDFPLGVEFHIGPDNERFGADPARLRGPTLERGYLPIVQTQYTIAGSTVSEEAFAPIDAPYAGHGAILVRFVVDGDASIPINLALQPALQPAAPIALRDGTWQDANGRTLLHLGPGWTSEATANRVIATLNPREPLVLAVFSHPQAAPAADKLDEPAYQSLRTACAAQWEQWITQCAQFDVPEERVNRAWKATVIGNLMMATGDQMSYSAGNVYQRLYEAESGDALRSLLVMGLTDLAKQMTDPLLHYMQKGLGFHDDAFRLQLLAHVYWLTRDADFVRSRHDLWRPAVDRILSLREKDIGLLPKENYCGDVRNQVYSLNSNANCWRGLRDISAVLRDIGEIDEAQQIARDAAEFRARILDAVAKSESRNTQPTFIPIALFGAEKPYDTLTDTKIGSYWDLMIPYVLGSEILDDPRTDATLDYLQSHGGLCMGMIRFHQHSGLFANENGLDDLYTLRYTQTLLRRDDVDLALVSFYGKLAQGLTPDTFIGGEGSGLLPLDPAGRAMYLPPNSAGNGFFLSTLRELMVQDFDADHDGAPDTLRLLFATPRAWLEDGKTIRIAAPRPRSAPCHSSRIRTCRINQVTIDITPPPRDAKAIKLRIRLPDGRTATGASIGNLKLSLDATGTVDLPIQHAPFTVQFETAQKQP